MIDKKMTKPSILIGAAFAVGGANTGTRRAPYFLQQHLKASSRPQWRTIIWQNPSYLKNYAMSWQIIQHSCLKLSRHVKATKTHFLPFIIGGDHSCAIGTWQGIAQPNKKIGMLWIDAHFDSHTPCTSHSQRTHGMPLAILLGHGDTGLLQHKQAVIDAKYTIVFGVRSFEPEELTLLQQLNVRYYTMLEIKQRGLNVCFNEAWRKVLACKNGFGLSLDLDGIDPMFAPAVSVKEQHGLSWPHLLKSLQQQKTTPKLKAIEVVEFNPYLDRQKRTLNVIKQLFRAYR